jgi:hypothetical protein
MSETQSLAVSSPFLDDQRGLRSVIPLRRRAGGARTGNLRSWKENSYSARLFTLVSWPVGGRSDASGCSPNKSSIW